LLAGAGSASGDFFIALSSLAVQRKAVIVIDPLYPSIA
jgi:hypothetical protein